MSAGDTYCEPTHFVPGHHHRSQALCRLVTWLSQSLTELRLLCVLSTSHGCCSLLHKVGIVGSGDALPPSRAVTTCRYREPLILLQQSILRRHASEKESAVSLYAGAMSAKNCLATSTALLLLIILRSFDLIGLSTHTRRSQKTCVSEHRM